MYASDLQRQPSEYDMPDPDQLQADNQKLLQINSRYNERIHNVERLRKQNFELKEQIQELDTQLTAYKAKIKRQNIQQKNGVQTIEMSCKHPE